MKEYDCIVVGGGVTGAGILRDLALRGYDCLLLEKNDLSEGTTGRCHGMLHSGGRYVHTDPESARECAEENEVLKKIAPHIIDDCGGYFIGVENDDVEYGDVFKESCRQADVFTEEINPEKVLEREPNCNSQTQRAFRVKDAYIDPFLLTLFNALSAKNANATIKTYCDVQQLLLDGKQVKGVRYYDKIQKKSHEAKADFVINATGPWAAALELQLELPHPLRIEPTMGTLLVINERLVDSLLNRLRSPGDGDIFVPSHRTVLLGTTSIPVTIEDLNYLRPKRTEIERILDLGEYLIPSVRNYELLRYYSGARPLVASGGSNREASRKFEVIDYEKFGYPGMLTIFGGKLTTYRLMAEETVNLFERKMGEKNPCLTASKPLPGGESPLTIAEIKKELQVNQKTAFDMSFKWGTFVKDMWSACQDCMSQQVDFERPRIICNCENVTEAELRWARDNFGTRVLDDYRRRTRQGMGRCQGQFCYYRVADLEAQNTDKSHDRIMEELEDALEKRWKTQDAGDEQVKRRIKLAKYMYKLGGNL